MLWISISVHPKESNCETVVTYYSFNNSYVPEGYNCAVFCIIILFHQFAAYTLRTSLAVLYVILCCHFSTLLQQLSKQTFKGLDGAGYSTIKHHLVTHELLMKALKTFERTMSLPIFLIGIGDCIAMFYSFVKLDPFHQSGERWFLEHYTFWLYLATLRAVLSFLCVSLAASRVHEACKNTKDVQEEMIKMVIASDHKHKKELLLLLVSHNSPPFTLSAWGFFHFDRGMVLSAIGSILTYSLLILQLDTNQK
ncbi:hypothetical protein AVEN_174932-1 [Araneus ventricosus]|uniref:Gustatory receptor n=1 Tax=Araneus ventricosus TaxID=182803 RepID=A0A4Y2ATK8_ARAVE|nr:hypothetical protein AVEN_174932-1 [Araneus ventricosus]